MTTWPKCPSCGNRLYGGAIAVCLNCDYGAVNREALSHPKSVPQSYVQLEPDTGERICRLCRKPIPPGEARWGYEDDTLKAVCLVCHEEGYDEWLEGFEDDDDWPLEPDEGRNEPVDRFLAG